VAELEQALDAGVGRIVVDSFAEIARLAWLAEERGLRQPVLVRATVGVEAHTHEFIATAHEDQKFGFSVAGGDAFEACRRGAQPLLAGPGRRALAHRLADLRHLGFEVSAHRAVALLARLRDELGATPPYLDLGGGFGIAYTAADTPMDVPALAASMRAIVARECAAAGLAEPRLAVEPGRAIAGPASITLYEVGTVKDTPHRRYVSVDGGMSDNIRTAPVRRAVHLRARVPGQRGAAGAVPGGRQALRERRHRGPGHLAAGRPGARRPGRGGRDRGVLPVAGEQLQPPAAPPVVAVGDGRPVSSCGGRPSRTCCDWTCPDGREDEGQHLADRGARGAGPAAGGDRRGRRARSWPRWWPASSWSGWCSA
jgi:hypothetical protein